MPKRNKHDIHDIIQFENQSKGISSFCQFANIYKFIKNKALFCYYFDITFVPM